MTHRTSFFALLLFIAGSFLLPVSSHAQTASKAEAVAVVEDLFGGVQAGPDWYYAEFAGFPGYFNLSNYPYVFTTTLGWLYTLGNTSNAYIYSFDFDLWIYTNKGALPYIYVFGIGWVNPDDVSE